MLLYNFVWEASYSSIIIADCKFSIWDIIYRNENVKSQNKEIPKDEKIGKLGVNKYGPILYYQIVSC